MKWRLDLDPEEARRRLESALRGSPENPAVSAIAVTSDPLYGARSSDGFVASRAFRPRSRQHTFARIRIDAVGSQTELTASFWNGALRGSLLCVGAAAGFIFYGLQGPSELFVANLILAMPLALGGIYLLVGGLRDRKVISRGLSELFSGAVPAA